MWFQKPSTKDLIIKLDENRELIVVVKKTGRILEGKEKDQALMAILKLAQKRADKEGLS